MDQETKNRFTSLIESQDTDFDLAEAALLVAKAEYPDLDVDNYLHKLDKMADLVRHRLGDDPTPNEIALAINETFFSFTGMTGNWNEYYDPRNSYLNDVLDRKLGIPITLSVVYIELARRLGLSVEGLGFPGHFLVKYAIDDGEVVLDPFHGGQSLSLEELDRRLEETLGDDFPGLEYAPHLLDATPKKEILVRLLNNLKGIYRANSEWEKALSVQNLILEIGIDDPSDIYDRARLLERLECFQSAKLDYQDFIKLSDDEDKVQLARQRLVDLIQTSPALN